MTEEHTIKETEITEKPEIDVVKERLDDAVKEIIKWKRGCYIVAIMAIIGIIILSSTFVIFRSGDTEPLNQCIKQWNICTSDFAEYNLTHTVKNRNILKDFNATFFVKKGDHIKIIPELLENDSYLRKHNQILFRDPFDKDGEWTIPMDFDQNEFFTHVVATDGFYFDKKILKFEVVR